MTKEEKSIVNEYRKNWYYRLDEEKKNKMREYAQNRYYMIKAC